MDFQRRWRAITGALPGRTRGTTWLYFAFAAALWAAANPYIGIDHDARLYTVMALRWLSPEAYARDPWFAYGSQDQWSFFSPLFASLLSLFGVENGARLMVIASAAFFVLASLSLARSALRGPVVWLAALLLVSVPLCYSANDMLLVSESFATARAPAVSLSLLALAFGLRGRLGFALALHVAALLLHPSMAIAPLLITLLCRLPAKPMACLVGAGVFAAAGLLAAGASGLLPVIDGEWYAFVEPAALVFIGSWVRDDLPSVLSPILLLLIAHRYGSRRTRTLYGVAALVVTLALLLSLVAGDRMPVILLMQAQFWRALWIAKVLGAIALADLAARYLIRRHARSRWPLLVLIVPALSLLPQGWVLLAACLAISSLSGERWRGFEAVVLAHQGLAKMFVAVALAINTPGYLASLSFASTSVNLILPLPDELVGLLRTGGNGLLALLVWWAMYRRRLLLALLALPSMALAVALWDVRSPEQQHRESRYSVDGSRRAFSAQIQRGQTVYWHDATSRVWLELGTAGYASTRHATGLVFSRQRTHLLEQRLVRVAVRAIDENSLRRAAARGDFIETILRGGGDGDGYVKPFVLASYESLRPSTAFGIRFLCADKELDFVIDPMRFEGLYVAAEVEYVAGRRVVNYLYDCRVVRRQVRGASPAVAH